MAKKRRIAQRILIGISFLFFSIILLLNNTTQLLTTFGIPMTSPILTWITVIGILSASIWAIILAAMGEFS